MRWSPADLAGHAIISFRTLEFTTKRAALAAAADRAMHAAQRGILPTRPIRVATPAGNLIKYVSHYE